MSDETIMKISQLPTTTSCSRTPSSASNTARNQSGRFVKTSKISSRLGSENLRKMRQSGCFSSA